MRVIPAFGTNRKEDHGKAGKSRTKREQLRNLDKGRFVVGPDSHGRCVLCPLLEEERTWSGGSGNDRDCPLAALNTGQQHLG